MPYYFKNPMSYLRRYIWVLYSILFHWFMCLFLCQYHFVIFWYDFVVLFETWYGGISHSILFVQDCFNCLWSFVSLYKSWDSFSMSMKKGPGSFIAITLNMFTAFHYIVIFTILILTHYHWRSFRLLVSSKFLSSVS